MPEEVAHTNSVRQVEPKVEYVCRRASGNSWTHTLSRMSSNNMHRVNTIGKINKEYTVLSSGRYIMIVPWHLQGYSVLQSSDREAQTPILQSTSHRHDRTQT